MDCLKQIIGLVSTPPFPAGGGGYSWQPKTQSQVLTKCSFSGGGVILGKAKLKVPSPDHMFTFGGGGAVFLA